jgi:SSS family solute:Na+ symporter
VLKRNMSALPVYSLALGFIALLGFMAIAAGTKPIGTDGNTIVPVLFQQMFPSWFAGIAFAAIGIGALVPAAIMSIAAANLFTRNIYTEYVNRDATPAQEARVSRFASLVVKAGAVVVILTLDPQFSIDLQLIGGVIVLQTLPAVAISLYTRALHAWALIAGWAVGMLAGLYMLYNTANAEPPKCSLVTVGGLPAAVYVTAGVTQSVQNPTSMPAIQPATRAPRWNHRV